MNPTIVIVDYGAGNLRSVEKAFEHLGYPAMVSGEPETLLNAEGVILPGVGSSGSAMAALEKRGLVEPLIEKANSGTPFFGVCLGLQLLMSGSDEDSRPCLGLFPGWVRRIPPQLKVPHMGWNQVHIKQEHPVFSGVDTGSYFYFVHSYYTDPADDTLIVGTTDYGIDFCSVLASENLIATQFHPEKSGEVGLKLYENFVRMVMLKEASG
ncbi:MAG: glutamine amidotransferase [Chloroflexi bacterium]|jgi:glutamine amidotransferase|nr:MAG: glutamine amidotransferase [Chloroflexota bacterium]